MIKNAKLKEIQEIYGRYNMDYEIIIDGVEYSPWNNNFLKSLRKHYSYEDVKEFMLDMKVKDKWSYDCLCNNIESNIIERRELQFIIETFSTEWSPYETMFNDTAICAVTVFLYGFYTPDKDKEFDNITLFDDVIKLSKYNLMQFKNQVRMKEYIADYVIANVINDKLQKMKYGDIFRKYRNKQYEND